VVSTFDIARALALGADRSNSARRLIFAIGRIQAQACQTNHCPVGVATQDPILLLALDVGKKSQGVARFHRNTLKAWGEMTGAAGLSHPSEFLPRHMMLRQGDKSMAQGDQVYGYLSEGYLLDDQSPDY
jgi:glutamate synthase domain-containing protein 2